MASKKKKGVRQDNFEWDSDLDFDIPDFGGDNPGGISDDRKPITKGIKSVASGFGKSFANEARLRKTLTKSLPKEYAEPISKAFEVKNGAKDLYHIASGEVRETVQQSKRSVNRIVRSLESTIPRGLYERLNRMTSEDSASSYQTPTKEEIQEGTINSAITEMLATNAQIDDANRKQDNARKIIQDTIEKKRHEDISAIMGSVDQSLIAINQFQQNVGTNYMKKSLEMQFRSYFVQNDMLQLQSKFFQMFKDDLSAITKNTGLPDYVKKATKEALMERLREKTFDGIASSLSKRRNEWLSGVVKKSGDKIKQVGASVRDAGSQVLDTVENIAGMAGSGMGPSGSEMFGDVVGGFAGGKLQDYIAKKIYEITSTNPEFIKKGNKAALIAQNLPQWINEQVQNGKHSDKIPEFLKDILKQDRESGTVEMNTDVSLNAAAQFNEKNSRSLNVVIPELLESIRHEVHVLRTGNTNAKKMAYDHEEGKFITLDERKEKLSKAIVSSKTTERTQQEVMEIFKQIDPDGTKFGPEERDKIAAEIYEANKDNRLFDKKGMMRASTNERFSAAVDKHIGVDQAGVKEKRLSSLFGGLGSRNSEVSNMVQEMANSGRHGELAELGLLDPKTGRINLKRIREMELGKTSTEDTQLPPRPQPSNPPGPVASALGNIFSGGRVQAFAKGGVFTNTVVDQPTTFPMPEGKTGLMGEAGPEAIVPLSRDESGRLGIKSDGKSSKILIEIRDILKKIEEKGLGGGLTPEMLEKYFGDKASKVGGMAKGLGSKAWELLKSGNSKTWELGKDAFGLGKKAVLGTAKWLSEKKSQFDLFVEGEVEPRLSKAKMEAGKYIDVTTGKIIQKFEDIKGDVRDIDTGEIVLKADELKKAILKNIESGKSVAVSGLAWGKNAILSLHRRAKDAVGRLFGGAKTIYGVGFNTLREAYKHLTDGPMDVYVKDKYDTPVLLKRTMAAGLYFNKDDLSTITKVSEIKGAVVDNDENVVLTKEELAQGLYDKDGKEIKTGFDRVTQFVGNSIKKTLGIYKGILSKGLDMGKGAVDWVASLFTGKSPITMTGKKTNDILTAIYDLLNARMPGDKSPGLDEVLPNESASTGEPGKISKLYNRMRGIAKPKAEELKSKAEVKAEEIKDKLKEQTEKIRAKVDPKIEAAKPKVEELKTKVEEKFNQAKDKIKEIKDTPKEEVKKKVTEKLQEARDKTKAKLDEAKAKALELKEEHLAGPTADAKKVIGKVADKAKEKGNVGWEKLYNLISERFPKPEKKRFDDSNGDGVRDGSIDDLRAKRKKSQDEDQEKKEKALGGKPGGMGAFSALADLFKKKKKDEDEEKEDGLDLGDAADALGGNEDPRDAKRKRRLARMRANRPQGRLGKIASGAGKLLKKIPGAGAVGKLATKFGGSMAGRGLGMVGRGALGIGKGALGMLGGSLLGGAGRIALGAGTALLGGGLSSAGILSGGIGLLGSALGMAGTAVSAILASPVLVPALAVAAIGTAGYFAYKWMTKPDPQPIEKVRLVQYGWRANDIDAYKKMKDVEQKVSGAVTFKGEKAEFDPNKLNIQELMKIFNLDPSNSDDAKKFLDWFAGRFRPVYLNHCALIKTTNSPKALADVDDNKVELKKTYLDQCLFPGEHYSVYVNPEKDKAYLFTSQGTVERQIAASKEEVIKNGDKKPEDKKSLANAPTLAAAAAAKIAKDKEKLEAEKKLDADKAALMQKETRGGGNDEAAGKARRLAASLGAAGAMGPDGTKPVDPTNPIDAPSGPNGEAARPKSRTGVKPKSGDAAKVKEAMIKKMPQFGITSINQKAALLGNVEHESGFQPISENLNYKASTLMKLWPNRFPTMDAANKVASQGAEGIANSIYGNRMGNTGPTDGWDYRGRGPIQITGKSNYAAVGKVMGKNIVDDPDKLITDPEASAESALAYWRLNPKLGKAADAGNFDQVRKMINGGSIGAEDANKKVMEYLDQLKSGDSGTPVSSPSPTPPGTLVASPRPSNVTDNPNMGPTPETFSSPKPALVASPRPSYDPSVGSAASAPNASVRSATNDSYYQKESKVNTGDSLDIMRKSNDQLIEQTGLLRRIADGIDSLPERIGVVMGGGTPDKPETPVVNKAPPAAPKPMPAASLGFRRSLAGA